MLLGVSVAASLAFAAPAAALLLIFLVRYRSTQKSGADALVPARPPGRALALIFFLTMFMLLVIPLNHAEWKTLGVGATSLRQTVNELTAISLGTSLKTIAIAARVALALLALLGVVAAFRYWRRPDQALIALSCATLALTLVLLLAAHRWLRTPFPQQGAVYLIPIISLVVTALTFKQKNKAVQVGFLVLCSLIVVRYLSIFPLGTYAAGRQVAGGRTLAKTLRADAGTAPVRVGASLAAEPVMNYYRTRYRQGNWQRIERQPLTGTYDYYVLTPDDAALVDQRHLHVLYHDAGLTLAR
jgi:multisubunit Na+/H+ antiporter MnhB subunit